MNILDTSDKVTVNGRQFTVSMNGPPKIYAPSNSLVSDDLASNDAPQQDPTTDRDVKQRSTHEAPPGTA